MKDAGREPGYFARMWSRWCAPRTWLIGAALIAVVYVIEHLLGWRDYTSILSGTLPAAGAEGELNAILGMLYILTWFAFVILAPILLIGAVLNYALRRVSDRQPLRCDTFAPKEV